MFNINTLIVDDNLQYVKNFINTTLNNFENIKITHIATTAIETIEILKNNKIDLIFLDLKLPDFSGVEILEKIKFLNIAKFPYIIVVSGDKFLINKVYKNYHILEVIDKLEDTNVKNNKIKTIIHEIKFNNNEQLIKEKIIYDLTNMGFNWKYKGTQYLLEIILYIYRSNNLDLLDNLEQNVYKHISYIKNKSINNIKTNIIKATNLINLEKSTIENPTPKLIISNIITKLLNDI